MEEHFRKKEEALERLEAALDKASENANPFDELAEPKEPGTPKKLSVEEVEQLLRESAAEIKVKDFSEVWQNIKARINAPQDEQKPAKNGENQKVEQTDKPAETKPERAKKVKKAKSEPKGSEQLRGQMTLDDAQNQPEQQKP